MISTRLLPLLPALFAAATTAPMLTPTATAQSGQEWEQGEGWNTEEWYDPVDWFDEEGTSWLEPDYGYDAYDYGYTPYEDWYDYDYDYPYGYDPDNAWYDYGYEWYEPYDYGYGGYDPYATGYDGYHPYDYGYSDYDFWSDYGYSGYDDYANDWYGEDLYGNDAHTAGSNGGQNENVSQNQGQRGNASSNRGGPTKGRRTATLQGTVQDWRRMSFDQRKPQHTFVKLQLRDGRTQMVDMGPNVDLSQVSLDQGDHIMVQGPTAQLRDRAVLLAQRFKVEGDRLGMSWTPNRPYVDRSGSRGSMGRSGQRPNQSGSMPQRGPQQQMQTQQQQHQHQQQQQQQQTLTFRGRIDDVRRIGLRGEDRQHTLTKIRLQDGSVRIVDLGPHANPTRLSRGDRIEVQGPVGSIGGHPVLMARQARVDESTQQQAAQPSR